MSAEPPESGGEASDAADYVVGGTPLSSPPSSQSPASWTHDTSRARYHMRDLASFAQVLEDSASRAFPNRGQLSRYKKVQVLLLRWKDDDLDVCWEVEDLEKVFQNYGFTTELWLIPSQNSHLKLNIKASLFVEEHESHETLIIVYYGGHALINTARQSTWSCKRDVRFASLEWSAIQRVFEKASSDCLLLLDCCAAASAAPANGTAITETIAACGWESIAAEPGPFSFTNTLISVLDDWINRPFTAAMLHSELLSRLKHEKPVSVGNQRVERRRTPVYIVTTANIRACSIRLSRLLSPNTAPLTSAPSYLQGPVPERSSAADIEHALTELSLDGKNSTPHVLISIALEEDQSLDPNACSEWLSDFPALAKHVKVQGVYQSHSTLLLVSIPVAIWDLLPDNPASAFIGYICSDNLLHQELPPATETRVDDDLTANLRPKPLRGTKSIEISLNSIPMDPEDLDNASGVNVPEISSGQGIYSPPNLALPALPLLRTDLLSENHLTQLKIRRKSADSGFASASSYSRHETSTTSGSFYLSPVEMIFDTPKNLSPKLLSHHFLDVDKGYLQPDFTPSLKEGPLSTTGLGIPKSELHNYTSCYWINFNHLFPIIHKETYIPSENVLLDAAIASIGSQYSLTEPAREYGAKFNDYCKKTIEQTQDRPLPVMQAIFLTEMFTVFRGRKMFPTISSCFEELQRSMAEDLMSEMMSGLIKLLIKSVGEIESSGTITIGEPELDEQAAWYRWIRVETQHRLSSACFAFDVRRAYYHEQPRSKGMMNTTSASFPYLPCPDELWHASSATEWNLLYNKLPKDRPRVTWQLLQHISPAEAQLLSPFSQTILIAAAASYLAPRDAIFCSIEESTNTTVSPTISNMDRIFRGHSSAEALLMFYHTPLSAFLCVSKYTNTGLFSDKETIKAQSQVTTWSNSLHGVAATQHACRILLFELTALKPNQSLWQNTRKKDISDYWALFVAALICYNFGAHGGQFTPASQDPYFGDASWDEVIGPAVGYLSAMLQFGARELLGYQAKNKASQCWSVLRAVEMLLNNEDDIDCCAMVNSAWRCLQKIISTEQKRVDRRKLEFEREVENVSENEFEGENLYGDSVVEPGQPSFKYTEESLEMAIPQAKPQSPAQQMYARALYDYEAKTETEVSFKEGDVIQVLASPSSGGGWWDGVVNEKRGWFPSNHCQVSLFPSDKEGSKRTSERGEGVIMTQSP